MLTFEWYMAYILHPDNPFFNNGENTILIFVIIFIFFFLHWQSLFFWYVYLKDNKGKFERMKYQLIIYLLVYVFTEIINSYFEKIYKICFKKHICICSHLCCRSALTIANTTARCNCHMLHSWSLYLGKNTINQISKWYLPQY